MRYADMFLSASARVSGWFSIASGPTHDLSLPGRGQGNRCSRMSNFVQLQILMTGRSNLSMIDRTQLETAMANTPERDREKSELEVNRNRPAPRDKTLHFRLDAHTAEALELAASTDQRSVSAWVAICVADRLREQGKLS